MRIRDLDTQEGEPLCDLGQEVRRVARAHEVMEAEDRVWAAAPAAEARQVLGILVDNAERHNPQGTPIELGWRREGELAAAWVRDEGAGMTPDVVAHAFDRFFRGDRQGGLGLGLALAKVLVESRGGTVEIETAEGKGTRVDVRWPVGHPPTVEA